MVILLHGDDIVLSRKALHEEKNKYKDREIVILDGSTLSLAGFVTAVTSSSLLSTDKLIIIENLLKNLRGKQREAILADMLKSASDKLVILWEDHEVDKTKIKKLGNKIIIKHFPLPKIIFKFLDSFGIYDTTSQVKLLQKVVDETTPEFVQAMLIRQIRFLIIASEKGISGLSDLASWQARKFINQAKYFNVVELINLYRNLISWEYKMKAGLTPYSTKEYLDIVSASI